MLQGNFTEVMVYTVKANLKGNKIFVLVLLYCIILGLWVTQPGMPQIGIFGQDYWPNIGYECYCTCSRKLGSQYWLEAGRKHHCQKVGVLETLLLLKAWLKMTITLILQVFCSSLCLYVNLMNWNQHLAVIRRYTVSEGMASILFFGVSNWWHSVYVVLAVSWRYTDAFSIQKLPISDL